MVESIRPARLGLAESPRSNRLVALLPDAVARRVFPYLELFEMPLGAVVYESGQPLEFVYFPTTSIVSLVNVMHGGATAEIAVTGKEGLVGISSLMSGESTPTQAIVQSAGYAYRLNAEVLRQEFTLGGECQAVALRFIQALMTQMAQTAACNRHHSVDQQLCRWLLMSIDRVSGDRLTMTQELIANMLGVRREGVTQAAGRLQEAGVIRYSRGAITVIDRGGLQLRACECYFVVRREYERLLGPTAAPG